MSSEADVLRFCLDTLPEPRCFICGDSIRDLGCTILGTETPFLGTPLADKLRELIGSKYLVVVSEEDKACDDCLSLMNHLDELEHELWITKRKVVSLLHYTYKLNSEDLLAQHGSVDEGDRDDHVKKNCADLPDSKTENNVLLLKTENIPSSPLPLEEFLTQNTNIALEVKVRTESSDLSPRSPESNEPYNDTSINTDLFKVEKVEEVHDVGNTILSAQGSLTSSHSPEDPDIFEGLVIPSKEFVVDTEKSVENVNKNHSKHEIEKKIVKDKNFVCDICDVPFPKPYLLTRHQQVHQRASKKVTCAICHLECHDRLHYIYHRKNKHDLLKRLTCTLCEKSFLSNRELKNHILSAHDSNDFQCTLCGQHFTRHNQFANHKLYAHGNRNCRICGKHISSDVKLRQHENRHAWIDSKVLDCDVCGRSFKTPGGLRVHKVSHTGNYKYFCEFCGRGFMSSVILEEHKGVHTKEERYVCDICGRKFVLYSTFHLHKQWHKDPFPFPCHICKKKFKYRSVRSIHIRRDHTGENPYKCHYCNAEFLKSISLKKHITSHTKEYPYNCSLCSKGFVQRRNLVRHMIRIHNDNSFNQEPKHCQYKVVLRPDEFPSINENV